METEQSFAAPPGPRWRTEPFRLFFPLAVVLSWVGIGHWLAYAVGLSDAYSCTFHGLVQMQAFMMALAVGFLLTALPRRTRGAPPDAGEMIAAIGALAVITAAAVTERMLAQQFAALALFAILIRFARRRFLGRDAARRPPAAFVLVPLAFVQGVGGAATIAAGAVTELAPGVLAFAMLLVEQGVFLTLTIGVGSLVLPLMAGAAPPPDLGSTPRETWKAAAYGGAGVLIVASLAAEAAGAVVAGPFVRGLTTAAALALGAGAWRPPGKPGLHRRLAWLGAWLIPCGLLLSALRPDYRVPALHVTFIGGFALLGFGVATHVVFGHLGLERLASGRPPAVAVLGGSLLLALGARFVADWSDTYFEHLGWAAACWLVGTTVWLGFVVPKLWRTGAG
jgi:uncharacterized protein involved in response to NO